MKLKKLSAACLAALISTVGLHSFMPESGFNSTTYAAETIKQAMLTATEKLPLWMLLL